MTRTYYFLRRNPTTGETLANQYIDAEGDSADHYFKAQKFFKYVGWSDGRFINAVKQRLGKDKDTGMFVGPSPEQKDAIKDACKKELEFALEHNDPPPDRSWKFFGGQRGGITQVGGAGEVDNLWRKHQ